jgi:hypothetical protein
MTPAEAAATSTAGHEVDALRGLLLSTPAAIGADLASKDLPRRRA